MHYVIRFSCYSTIGLVCRAVYVVDPALVVCVKFSVLPIGQFMSFLYRFTSTPITEVMLTSRAYFVSESFYPFGELCLTEDGVVGRRFSYLLSVH